MKKIALCLAILFICRADVFANDLTIAYIERPPYYYTQDSKVKGVLADLTEQILNTVAIPHTWKSLPPKRIITMLQNTSARVCSPGWFFKKDRMAYAQFTLPVYQNKPLSVLIKKEAKSQFEAYTSLATLFKDSSMVMGTVATYRYSGYIDDQIHQYHPKQIKVYTSASQLASMIVLKRIDYIIIAPVEAQALIRDAGLRQEAFEHITFPDIPPGNKRYLMCSNSVSKTTIDTLNTAIRLVVDPTIWKE